MKTNKFRDANFERIEESDGKHAILRDVHHGVGAEICFFKSTIKEQNGKIRLNVLSSIDVDKKISNDSIGTLIHGIENGIPVTIWLPREPEYYIFDKHGRARRCENTQLHNHGIVDSNTYLSVPASPEKNASLVFPYVKFTDSEGSFFNELSELSETEQYLFKRSEWFLASSVASIWNYLIHGSVYDPRESETTRSRFKCQQCAYAWWKYLHNLYHKTQKNMYALLRDEIAYSILLDMENDGGWRHGYWSDNMETHARFHLDGIELFIAQHELTSDRLWLDGCRRGMDFVIEKLTDRLDDGLIWFLHDTMEEEKNHRVVSAIFGKDPKNSLCINTHVHALRVLYRLQEYFPGDRSYQDSYAKGMQALHRVLSHQPADNLYRLFSTWILNSRVSAFDSRVLRRLQTYAVRWFNRPVYWKIMQKYPRLVHPNGFIERDLSITYASDRYHITNMKELLKLYELERAGWLRGYIVNGFEFLKRYIAKKGMKNVIRSSPYYIETIDIVVMYSRFIEELPQEYIESVRNEIYAVTGAYSIEEGETGKVEHTLVT